MFVDGFIKGGMKKSIPKEAHDTFLPYFGNKKFDILLRIQGSDKLIDTVTPFIVITSPDGTIQLAKQALPTTKNVSLIQARLKTRLTTKRP